MAALHPTAAPSGQASPGWSGAVAASLRGSTASSPTSPPASPPTPPHGQAALALARPGPVHGAYPMRQPPRLPATFALAWLQAALRAPARPGHRARSAFVQQVRAQADQLARLDAAALAGWTAALRPQLARHGTTDALVAQALARVALEVQRQRGLRLHDAQLLAAWWMLGGRLVEMATGEGKTLAMLAAAAVGALAGTPVHVLTANDYLAGRDADAARPLLAALGLTVGAIAPDMDAATRRAVYACDVAHASARELVFDHLRDACGLGDGEPVLRGLCLALVDEADSVLIDEARTPLILSRQRPCREAAERQRLALFLARQLTLGEHAQPTDAGPRLTEAGRGRLAGLCARLGADWQVARMREEQAELALAALHRFRRDVDYLVQDGEIHIIDATTGRRAAGRAWSRGLHQLIALKEGLTPQAENEVLRQTSYPRFFPRYLRLGGLSGTLAESRAELLAIYGLPVVAVPRRLPTRRRVGPAQLLPDAGAQQAAIVRTVRRLHARGRPVLIGTGSVAESEAVSAALAAVGLPHQVLNARQDAEEAAVIAQAGRRGAITVSTQMAGRGTDIPLGPGVAELGGLHVLQTALGVSARVDRQLAGRSARQGQPGSDQWIGSREDALLGDWRGAWISTALDALGPRAGAWLARRVQAAHDRAHRRQRWALLQQELALEQALAWAGESP
jgi:preprotein translocase subunit SecA